MTTDTLLIELGTEELPPKSLKTLAIVFYEQIMQQLKAADLSFTDIRWYATPRRLAVVVTELAAMQQEKRLEKRGPALNVAFDSNGVASAAAQGWARSNGISVEQAERLVTDKGEWLLYNAVQPGQTVAELIPDMVAKAITKLPIPKPMRWGNSKTQFIRPVHTLTMLYGSSIIDGEVLGVSSSNLVKGHRFHHHGMLLLNHAKNYQTDMLAAHVMVDYQQRKQLIQEQITKQAKALSGVAVVDEALLEEVTSLVEWPVVLVGQFDQAFLQVPAEPLISSMQDHQKYFPVQNEQGELLNKFIFVANIESKDASQIVIGNEKVIRPRLADAEFFFKTDKKQTLASRLASLASVLFQKQLGTVKDKSERIAALSQYIAAELGEDEQLAHRAGLLCKTDLMTEMVLEFPQVQGTMGKYYARHDGEHEQVAQALEDQYRPRFSGDSLPKGNIGCALAIADKIDTLVGIFGINQAPKGDKDPFALRRAAIGALRIIIEQKLEVDIALLVKQSIALYGDKLSNPATEQQVVDFVVARFQAYYQEQGYGLDVIQAVLAKKPTAPLDFDKRLNAVNYFKSLPEASTLAAANKRVGNILAKFNDKLATEFDISLADAEQELRLADDFSTINQRIIPLLQEKNYQAVLTELSGLKAPIDNFFDHVMVMADDEKIKINRLTLLNLVHKSFYDIADISVLQ
jgi:glycyl-tRNA synthetase beta chain